MKTDSISELLRVENLSRSFTTQVGEVKALQQVNLSIGVG
jgi:ABC-type dipeptide/oligopeptide/nickel transport system ATPase component